MRRRAALVACLGVLPAGCGGSGELEPQAQDLARAEQRISDRDIDRFPRGSPQRGLLTWWRNVQYRNYAGYLQYFTASARGQLPKGRDSVPHFTILAEQLRTAKPKILETKASGDRATVFTEVATRRPTPSGRFTATTVPQAFVLRREGNLWRLDDAMFVHVTIRPVLEAKERTR